MNKPIIYFNSLDSLSGNGSIAGTSGHIPAYDGNKDIIAIINNDAYFYDDSVSSWEKINKDYVAGNHINIQNKIIEVSGWENKLDTSAYIETSANIINIIKNKVDLSSFEISTSAINETIENKISVEEFENLSSSFITLNSPLTEGITSVINTVTTNSANWNNDLETLYSAGPNINITNNTISSKDWTPELNTKLDSSAFSNVSGKDWTTELNTKLDSSTFSDVSGTFVQTLPESANWTKAYETVTANSANWDEVNEYSAGSNINITNNTISSKDWTPELNTKLDSSAFSNVSGTFVQTLSESANWTKAYDTVTANSANWINDLDTLYSAGSNVDITDNTISSRDWTPELSAKLDSSAFTLPTSANWTKAYETVTANSASWNEDIQYSAGTNINITNNTISSKDWTPELNAKLNSTAFSSVSGKFIQTLPASSNWNNTYSAVNSESANWTKAYDTVTANSASWNNDLDTLYSAGTNINITNNTISSKDWTPELNAKLNSTAFTLPTSSNWNNVYSTVSANSANWNNDLEALYSAGPNINITNNTISSKDWTPELNAKLNSSAFSNVSGKFVQTLPTSANWNKAYETVTANSANWNNDLDSLYSAGPNINITNNTISSKDWTPELNTKLNSSAFSDVSGKFVQTLPTSANWDKAYETVTANSANWDEVNEYSAGPNINITNNTISSKDWTPELNAKLNSSAFFDVSGKFVQSLPTSANWDKAYETVTANSANWDEVIQYSAGTNINITNNTISSKDWTPELNAKLNSTAFALPTSSNWTKAYETVTANSANWNNDLDTLYSAGTNINITNNTISSKDWTPELNTKLNSTAFSNVSGKFVQTLPTSANWDKAYETVTANSASWENDIDVSNFVTSSTELSGSYILSSNGSTTTWHKLEEEYDLSGFNGIIISANSANKTINVGYNGSGPISEVVYTLSAGQNIGIQSATDGINDYLVISANANSNVSLPISSNWNNTYDTVTTNSANWNSVSSVTSNIINLSAGQNIGIQSATDGINDYLVISANSNSNVSLPESANWTKAYDTVTANSANWNNGLDTLYSAGTNINITNNTISSKDWTPELNAKLNSTAFTLPTSANWTKAYETVTANSASWNNDLDTLYSAGSNINITNSTISSRDWTPELNTKLNSSAFSNVSGKFVQTLPTSSNWNNVYNTVTANSANWDEVIDVSNFITSSTELSGSYILSSNGSTTTWHELEEEYELSGLNGVFISANSANKSIDISLTECYDISGFNGILVSANSANKTIDITYSGNLDDLTNNTFILQAGQNVVLTSGENGDNKYLTISAAGIESIGTPYELSGGENINITSASVGTNNYLVISAKGGDSLGTPYNLSAGQNIGIQSATDGINDYLVISANGGDSLGTPYNLSAGQNIGIQSATDGINDYLVISANAITEIDLPESANWNNTYSTVTTNSANWNSVSSVTSNVINLSAGQNIGIQSATDGINDYLVISANSNSNVSLPESANWNNTYSTVNSESANWNNTYNTVTTNSANWNSVSSITSNIMNLSAGQNIGIQSATDGVNDYLVISAIGGGEGATYVAGSNINITNNTISSKDWTPELNAKLNSTAFTLPESANWNNTYSTVNSESANWNSVSSITSNILNLSAGQNIGIQSATVGDTDYLVISAIGGGEGATYVAGTNINITNNTISSKDWTPELNAKLNSTAFTLPESANWNNTYSTVTNNSADWSGMYSLVAGNSGYWGQGEGTVFELYSSNGTIGVSSTTATGNKIIYDISLEGTTTSRNYFINRQEQTDAAEYLPNTNITLPDLGNGWQIVNGEANYGDIKYTSLSAYSMNGSAYIIPEEVKLASVDIRLDVIIPSGGLSANYQKVEIVIFDDIKNEYIGKYEKWIDISYDRTEQLNFSEIITEPSSVKLYFRSEFACQTYCRTFSLVDLTYKMLLINNNVTGGSVSLPTSANWNNTYSIVTSNSANWNSVSSITSNIMNLSAGQNIGIQSATVGDTDYLVISANAITEIDLPESANWNNTYSTVTTNSANWNSVSSLSAKGSSILCQNISYTATGSNINVTIPNNTYATVSGLNVTGTINVIIPATNVINGSELNSCAGRLTFSTNKPSTLNFVDSSITSKLPVIGQLPTTYSGTNYQFTCVAGVVACQEIKTIT